MANKKQKLTFHSSLSNEIKEFLAYKRQIGHTYITSEFELKAFDRFCDIEENRQLTPQELAVAWMKPSDDKPKYGDGCSVRQLGQYLVETGHTKAFTILSDKGNVPKKLFMKIGPFEKDIKDFIEHKRLSGRKYITAEHSLNAFNLFCAMNKDNFLLPQQFAEAWCNSIGNKMCADISAIREFGLHLTLNDSKNAFLIPYANGDMPKPAFAGYTCIFAKEIDSFLRAKRSDGLKYREEEFRLKDFDRFCNEHSDLPAQQLADAFIHSCEETGYYMGRRGVSVIRAFGNYLTENGSPNAFTIIDNRFIAGPYAEEIAVFVAFKRSSGFKYPNSAYHVRCFDAFCTLEENKPLTPQQLADKWVLKRENENPNTRAGRVGPVRVFGKYLVSIGHPKAFLIADDIAQGGTPAPPYLFTEYDIDEFFSACAMLKSDEKDPSAHIVLPAAFLFMHCMGVRTGELKILMENVNFDTGEVIIVDAKTGDRSIYMSGDLSEILFQYNTAIEKDFPCHKYLFPASVSRSRNDFAKRFSEIWATSVPAAWHGKPRLYDFRHHLLYRNVELHMRNGGDVNTLRPYIMKHMGHKHPESFQYYFHLSPPIQKEISKIKISLDWMMPDVPEVPYE